MIFTKGEIEILELCALCKDLPVETNDVSEQEIIDILLYYKFLRKKLMVIGGKNNMVLISLVKFCY